MSVLAKVRHIGFIWFLLIGTVLSAQAPVEEYKIKAAFIFNFTQFVNWPEQSLGPPGSPFVIGILGEDPFEGYLQEIIKGESVKGHPLVIRHFKNVEDVKSCHVLFIDIKGNDDAILKKLEGRNILTISEEEKFAHDGGMVRIYTKQNKIQIQINPEAANKASLTISSKLLKLVEIVKSD